jgi:hypothetical protein
MLGGEKIDAWQSAKWKSFVWVWRFTRPQFGSIFESMMDAGA